MSLPSRKQGEPSLLELLGKPGTSIPNFKNLQMSRQCSCSLTL